MSKNFQQLSAISFQLSVVDVYGFEPIYRLNDYILSIRTF